MSQTLNASLYARNMYALPRQIPLPYPTTPPSSPTLHLHRGHLSSTSIPSPLPLNINPPNPRLPPHPARPPSHQKPPLPPRNRRDVIIPIRRHRPIPQRRRRLLLLRRQPPPSSPSPLPQPPVVMPRRHRLLLLIPRRIYLEPRHPRQRRQRTIRLLASKMRRDCR